MKLYELSEMYNEFFELLEAEEIPVEAIADTLEGLQGSIEVKADNIASMIKSLTADAQAIKNEEEALYKRRQAKAKQVDGLKNYLSYWLQFSNIDKVETTRNKISFRNSSRIKFVDERELITKLALTGKNEYIKYGEATLRKDELTKALKAGAEIDGVVLENYRNLQIK